MKSGTLTTTSLETKSKALDSTIENSTGPSGTQRGERPKFSVENPPPKDDSQPKKSGE